jgi:hypothetical protein
MGDDAEAFSKGHLVCLGGMGHTRAEVQHHMASAPILFAEFCLLQNKLALFVFFALLVRFILENNQKIRSKSCNGLNHVCSHISTPIALHNYCRRHLQLYGVLSSVFCLLAAHICN